MHLDQPLDDRKTDAETALRAVERSCTLHEEVEHVGQQVRRDPAPSSLIVITASLPSSRTPTSI
jgi:hypothetical protein